MPTTSLTRDNLPLHGRLVVLETGRTKGFDPFAGLDTLVAINLPSMPDSVDLARSVEYLVVNSPVMPDGIHQYRLTTPLAIPIAFRLSAFDKEFCPRGALSLLELAALLHSFSLPISASLSPWVHVTRKTQTERKAQNTAALEASGQSADNPYNIRAGTQDDEFYPPVTLRLELIYIDNNSPGVVCTGYVKDVSAKLNGPWRRGPNNSYNLPSSCDFSFTFVHVPGYGNSFSVKNDTPADEGTMGQAYADHVKDKLYNTIELSSEGVGYRGYLKK